MGLSLKNSAERFSKDQFSIWDPQTGEFDTSPDKQLTGKRFKIDRFTTIYHRPTRRTHIRLLTDQFPGVGVVRREGIGEVYLLSKSLNTDVDMGRTAYERLRMGHLVMPPSGGLGEFQAVVTRGSGDTLGPVTLAERQPAYLDLELQSATEPYNSVDTVVSKFILNYSANIDTASGDLFYLSGRTFVVLTPYIDGGFNVARVLELDSAYETFICKKKAAVGAYDPVTGSLSSPARELLFSGIVESEERLEQAGDSAIKLVVYVYFRHVGFQFSVGDTVIRGSQGYYVSRVSRSRESDQWRLELSR